MPDTYRSPASLAPINSKKKMERGESRPIKPVSMAGGGRAYTLASFQEGMSVGLITAGV